MEHAQIAEGTWPARHAPNQDDHLPRIEVDFRPRAGSVSLSRLATPSDVEGDVAAQVGFVSLGNEETGGAHVFPL